MTRPGVAAGVGFVGAKVAAGAAGAGRLGWADAAAGVRLPGTGAAADPVGGSMITRPDAAAGVGFVGTPVAAGAAGTGWLGPAAGTTVRGCGATGVGCPAGAGIGANVFGTRPLGRLGAAGVAGPGDGVPPRIPSAGTVGPADVLGAGRFTAPTMGCAGTTRGATVGAPCTIGPVAAGLVLGALAPPSSRFWLLVDFILDARSRM